MKNPILEQVKQAIRSPYAWPGGYPVYTVLSDGALLCPHCARAEFKQIAHATRTKDRGGWQAIGAEILWETETGPEHCAHCNEELASAYGDTNDGGN